MPITELIKRASGYLLGYESDDAKTPNAYNENEILFCKNNVCVHPPTVYRQNYDIVHNPGYLTITTKTFVDQHNDVKRPTLFLTWIPNTTLRKCSTELESAPKFRDPDTTSLRSDRMLLKQNGYYDDADDCGRRGSTESLDVDVGPVKNGGTNPFRRDFRLNFDTLVDPDTGLPGVDDDLNLRININVQISNPKIEIIATPESVKDNFFDFSRSNSIVSYAEQPWVTPEMLAQRHNLTFPDSQTASPILSNYRREIQRCRRFSVDLSQMRSLRLFFSDNSCTCGQLVVASRESQYKILHFHHGGLDHLAQVLHQWHSLLHSIKLTKGADENLPYRHFMVCRPEVTIQELHPDEGLITKLTTDTFRGLLNDSGQIEDDLSLRRAVFFGGIERGLRSIVWPFLLHVYPYQSTYEDRIRILEIRRQEYEEITRRRLNDMTETESEKFMRTVQCIVEKDVVRTDRGNPFFAGEENPNIETMKNVLLNYAYYNPSISYTQGMSDLLAPVLCEIGDEALTFWCFVGLMQRAAFVATPTDNDMEKYLKYLRELIRLMVPHFYQHLEQQEDALELLFCHRWILLCFKREFTEGVALQMWEACWSNYLTDYFHLFLCLAIICVYADDVIAQNLRADEMLLHFSSLAMYMDGQVILRKARGLLHQYRQRARIPCTLRELCTRCGPGIWDSTHSPVVECVGSIDCACNDLSN